jgi:glycerophosphoryl diester phosphodiesterase
MRLIADRGFSNLYPENTLRAVEEAVAVADSVAVDVRQCATGELVVLRDETVNRVSDGSGRVTDHSYEALAALDILGTSEGVPRLEAVAEAVPRGIGLVVTLRQRDLTGEALSVLSGVDTHAVLASTAPGDLTTARVVDASVPRAFVFGEDTDPQSALSTAQGLDAAYLYAPTNACTERLLGDAHTRGMMVVAWPVTSRSEATKLQELGVDGVVADRWGVLPRAEL